MNDDRLSDQMKLQMYARFGRYHGTELVLVIILNNKNAAIEKFSFSETQDILISFDITEKRNINFILQSS